MKKKTLILIVIGLIIAVIALFLAVRVTPWFYSINTRVRLNMEAPADTVIKICWDEKRIECLPLVPYSETSNTLATSGEITNVWLGQLPPRPVYHVSLIFDSGVHEATFHTLELDSSTQIVGVLPGAGVGHVLANADQFKFRGVSYELINAIYKIESEQGGKLILAKEIRPVLLDNDNIRIKTLTVWALLYSIFLLFMIPFYLLPRAVENLGSAPKTAHLQKSPWWVYILSGVAIGFMLLVIVKSPVIINEADPIGYLRLATGEGWFNAYRMPGYPIFLGLALWLSNYSLNGDCFISSSAVGFINTILHLDIATMVAPRCCHSVCLFMFTKSCAN